MHSVRSKRQVRAMSWAVAAEQYCDNNLSVTVNLAEPALGSHLVNQTYPQGNQNDLVNAYKFSKFANFFYKFSKFGASRLPCVQYWSKFGAYNIEAITAYKSFIH